MEDIKKIIKPEHIYKNEPMSRHTTFHTGGPADYYCTPDEGELPELIGWLNEHSTKYTVIGNGSNLLVSDDGVEGFVIEIGRNMSGMHCEENLLIANAGEMLGRLSSFALQNSLTGLEFASGIPGTVGGAVYMNAGAYDGEIAGVLKEVKLLSFDKDKKACIKIAGVGELGLSYRRSVLMETGDIVLSAVFELERGDSAKIKEKMEDFKKRRQDKQPLEYYSAGSTFKRPEGYFAGKLIEDAGLRGFRIGDAQVSEKHCGFVINRGKASSKDIRQLMDEVTGRVFETSGVMLVPEVRLTGRW